ncbi:MAG TPA: lysine--tRNA ligase [Candidatus Paceibacterota bacterium]|nr:lysine--tRNA ligase [Candidatus Paceibacterota bacterium]
MPLDELLATRQEKLAKLRKAGVDPYPIKTWRTHRIGDVVRDFDALSEERRSVVIAGRVVAQRVHGGLAFTDLDDGSGVIQAMFRKDELGDATFELLLETLDAGDFLEVSGIPFLTKRNERSVQVAKYRYLTKATRPLPEKWHGLQDVEERYRARHLDLLFNPEVKARFTRRFAIMAFLRKFFADHGYLEVQTPLLQTIPGGATARPFVTHMNDLDMDLYLRVAPELYLKRLLVGGYERVFELGKCFRNEGMDREHNPEFTMLEAYAAYQDHEWLMGLTEDLVIALATELNGKPELTVNGETVTIAKPFPRLKFTDIIKEHAGLEYDLADDGDFAARAKELGCQVEKGMSKPALADEIYKKLVRPDMREPVFVTEHPVDLSPLSKRTSPDAATVARFQLVMGGFELCNAFAELNDPGDQRERFAAQQAMREGGDEEAHRFDEDFVQALEYGMPPAAGIGIGVDRLVALFTDAHSLREVLLFPTMKPRT